MMKHFTINFTKNDAKFYEMMRNFIKCIVKFYDINNQILRHKPSILCNDRWFNLIVILQFLHIFSVLKWLWHWIFAAKCSIYSVMANSETLSNSEVMANSEDTSCLVQEASVLSLRSLTFLRTLLFLLYLRCLTFLSFILCLLPSSRYNVREWQRSYFHSDSICAASVWCWLVSSHLIFQIIWSELECTVFPNILMNSMLFSVSYRRNLYFAPPDQIIHRFYHPETAWLPFSTSSMYWNLSEFVEALLEYIFILILIIIIIFSKWFYVWWSCILWIIW